jgi:hypothetical protein
MLFDYLTLDRRFDAFSWEAQRILAAILVITGRRALRSTALDWSASAR